MNYRASFNDYILKEVNRIMRETGNKIADELVRRLPPESIYYKRTYDVERALRNPPEAKIIDNEVRWAFIDFNLIKPRSSISKRLFNHHMSWSGSTTWRGKYIPYNVPYFLDEGFKIKNGKGITVKKFQGLRYINGALNDNPEDYITSLLADAISNYISLIKQKLG